MKTLRALRSLALISTLTLTACGSVNTDDRKSSKEDDQSAANTPENLPGNSNQGREGVEQSGAFQVTETNTSYGRRGSNGHVIHSHLFAMLRAEQSGVVVKRAWLDGTEIGKGGALSDAQVIRQGLLTTESIKDLDFGSDDDEALRQDLREHHLGKAYFYAQGFLLDLDLQQKSYKLKLELVSPNGATNTTELTLGNTPQNVGGSELPTLPGPKLPSGPSAGEPLPGIPALDDPFASDGEW